VSHSCSVISTDKSLSFFYFIVKHPHMQELFGGNSVQNAGLQFG